MTDNNPLSERTDTIRALNDKLRRGQISGTISFVGGLAHGDDAERAAAIAEVQNYAAFDPNDDPYGEHDFGSFVTGKQKYMWKIDYYDLSFEGHSPDPADPKVTNRVLTIFHAEDY